MRTILATSAFLWLAGCAGDVTVSGQGGASQGGTTTGAGGAAPTRSASTSAGDPADVCDALCAKLASLGCPSGSCQQDCAAFVSGACSAQATAVVSCFAANATSCDDDNPPPACTDELTTLDACEFAGCMPGTCSGMGSSGQSLCECKATCPQGELAVSCSSAPDGDHCDCLVNGMVIGSCVEPISTQCSIQHGCCSNLFH